MSTQRTALVTGGNRGIGLAICEGLADRGLYVVMGSRDETNGEAAAASIRERGGSVRVDQLDEAWTVNTRGPWLMVKAFVPGMVERGYGRVVNVSSGSGSFGEGLDTNHAAYAASKAGLNALTMTLDDALPGGPDVKVNSMGPGWVHTRMGGEAAPRTPEEGADTALWLATLPEDEPSGGFFRDRERIPW